MAHSFLSACECCPANLEFALLAKEGFRLWPIRAQVCAPLRGLNRVVLVHHGVIRSFELSLEGALPRASFFVGVTNPESFHRLRKIAI